MGVKLILVQFVFCGAEDDDPFSILIPIDSILTLKTIRSHFPFEGRYHFRIQEYFGTNGNYIWRDLIDDGMEISNKHGDILIKVLQLSCTSQEYPIYSTQVENSKEKEFYTMYFHTTERKDENEEERIPKSLNNMELLWKNTKRKLNKTSAKVWETVEFTAGRYFGSQSGAEKPTAAALQQLASKSSLYRTTFNESNREHVDYLRRLWNGVYGESRPFARPSSGWIEIGFPTDDPVVTLKSRGVLSLHALVFFSEVHRNASVEMLHSNGQYSYVMTALNVISILAEIIDLDSGRFLERDEVYWKLFEDPIGFFELFSVTFHAYDSFSRHAKQNRSFHTPIEMVKQYACRLLMQGPKSVEELVHLAHEFRLN